MTILQLEREIKQLDVDVSPSANIMTFRLVFIHVTFDPDHECIRVTCSDRQTEGAA